MFQSLLLLARNLDVKAPVEVYKVRQVAELILKVALAVFSHRAHSLEQKGHHLLGEGFRESSSKGFFVVLTNCDVFLHQSV